MKIPTSLERRDAFIAERNKRLLPCEVCGNPTLNGHCCKLCEYPSDHELIVAKTDLTQLLHAPVKYWDGTHTRRGHIFSVTVRAACDESNHTYLSFRVTDHEDKKLRNVSLFDNIIFLESEVEND